MSKPLSNAETSEQERQFREALRILRADQTVPRETLEFFEKRYVRGFRDEEKRRRFEDSKVHI